MHTQKYNVSKKVVITLKKDLLKAVFAGFAAIVFFTLGALARSPSKDIYPEEKYTFISGQVQSGTPIYGSFKKEETDIPEVSGEMRAVWVASVYNLNYPSRAGLSSDELKDEGDALIEKTVRGGFNTIFFQVRPCSDALYNSGIFPSSHFLVSNQGDTPELDLLAYLSEKCAEKGIMLYAWINPFRITVSPMEFSSLSSDNPALCGEYSVYEVGGNYYYDPGDPSVRDLIINGVMEICKGYNVNGIVFDDYFYAEGITNEDSDTYNQYNEGRDIGDFRRESVNQTIKGVYDAIKAFSPDISFCVSVRGIWQNKYEDERGSETLGGSAYSSIYCDALAFIEGGYVDIISPQIYWPFDSERAPFATLADWWEKAVAEYSDGNVSLAVSLAAYALSDEEIERQKEYIKKAECYKGFALYNASCLD